MNRPNKITRMKEAFSQLLCVIFVDGDADEMLSSWSYRNNSWLIKWLDWLLGENHCKEAYEWEKQHYNLDRFKGNWNG